MIVTYYVATNGNDANPGTLAQPFKTIQKAANVAQPGDTVIVRDGTYTSTSDEWVHISRSGTIGNIITFRSENKGGAILDGQGLRGYCFIFDSSASYINISGFEVKNFKWFAFNLNQTANPVNHIIISDNHVHHIGRYDDTSTQGHCGIYINKAQDIIIERNLFNDIGRLDPTEGGTNSNYQNHDHGIYLSGGTNIDVRYNIFYNCNRGWGIQVYSSSGYTTYNLNIYNNTFDFGNPYRNGAGITLAATINGCNIKNNIFGGDGVECDWGISTVSLTATNVLVSYNLVHGGGSTGYAVSTAKSGLTVSNNQENTNPVFVNANSYNFHLQGSSPAIDHGTYLALISDFDGVTVSNPPEMGAYEYVSTTTTTTTLAPTTTTTSTTITPTTTTTTTNPLATTTTTTTGIPTTTTTTTTVTPTTTTSTTAVPTTTTTTTGIPPTTTTSTTRMYYSVQMSVTVKRDDCPSGYTGSSVVYTVYAGKYISVISQADADAQAYADLNLNKQTYANTYGVCTAITVYYNVRMSAKATRNNCPAGYTGSTVTYTVPAGKYSSTISQADANYKAQLDLDVNKQAYANSHGTCKKNRSWR